MTTKANSFVVAALLCELLVTGCRMDHCTITGRKPTIAEVFVDVSRLHHDASSNGDTWDYIWAEDDNLYTFGCDGKGYGASSSMNVNFNRLKGSDWKELTGQLVNPMTEYGLNGAYLADDSTRLLERNWSKIPQGPNWKVTGADCIDGVIYAFVAENWYGNQKAYGSDSMDPTMRQTVNNMSLIKSTDKGLTWTRTMAANASEPMWTNKRFSTGFFFKYGQNGGRTRQDKQDKYVYAMSNDGYWNSGSAFYLGRVLRAKIGNLNAADWEYSSNGSWTSELNRATPVSGLPNGENKCTMGTPVWLAALHKYVAPVWYDTGDYHQWYFPTDVTFAFYQADHPWGPWDYIGEKSALQCIADRTGHAHRWYGPVFSPKFITDNPDGSVTALMLFSGSTWENNPSSLYKNCACPVTFYARAQPKLRETCNDTKARYSDGWFYQTNRNVGDWSNDAHVTTNCGSHCEFTFHGEGIEVLSEKFHDMGDVEVLLDGQSQGIFHLYQDPMPRLYQIPFYRKMDLAKGQHTVRVINRAPAGAFCIIDGFKIYGSP